MCCTFVDAISREVDINIRRTSTVIRQPVAHKFVICISIILNFIPMGRPLRRITHSIEYICVPFVGQLTASFYLSIDPERARRVFVWLRCFISEAKAHILQIAAGRVHMKDGRKRREQKKRPEFDVCSTNWHLPQISSFLSQSTRAR